MRKKRYMRNIILSIIVTGFFITGCDKLDAPYATVKPQNHDTTDTTTVVRKVLLEDYTGHTCVNCPTAARTAELIKEVHDGRVIVMAMHAGWYARVQAAPYDVDFQTTAGTSWNNYFNFSSWPNGLVNRKIYNESLIVSFEQWESAISAIIDIPPDAGIKITSSIDTNSRLLTIDIQSKFLNTLTGNYNITVCVIENGIVGAQKNNNPEIGETPEILDYVFRDMLRKTLTPEWGELVTTDPQAASEFHSHFSGIIETKIDLNNASIVAFITNADTKEVIQAEEKKIIE